MTTQDRSKLRVLALMEAITVSGPGKNLIALSRHARALGADSGDEPAVEVSLATFHRGPAVEGASNEDSPNPFVAAARAAGVEVDVIRERFRYDARALRELRAIVERRRPDIIETHNVKSHFLVKLSGLWRRHLWIAFHHGYTTTDLKMRLYNRLNRWSLPTAHHVVTVCGAFVPQIERDGVRPEKVSIRHSAVSPNGAVRPPLSEVRALKERLGIHEGQRVIVAVGRLSREKAHADLIEALGVLRETEPELDFRLVMVGEGPERANVERLARARAVADRLVFAGHVSDVRPFYALADVMALPSHSEGSPNVLLEAMAAGTPSVATAVGGVPEIATHEENALLVAPRDAPAMAAAIGRLLKDEGLARRLASNASALVAERYTPDAYARSVARLYRELLRDHRAAR